MANPRVLMGGLDIHEPAEKQEQFMDLSASLNVEHLHQDMACVSGTAAGLDQAILALASNTGPRIETPLGIVDLIAKPSMRPRTRGVDGQVDSLDRRLGNEIIPDNGVRVEAFADKMIDDGSDVSVLAKFKEDIDRDVEIALPGSGFIGFRS